MKTLSMRHRLNAPQPFDTTGTASKFSLLPQGAYFADLAGHPRPAGRCHDSGAPNFRPPGGGAGPKQLHELELADYLDIKRRSECGYGYKEC
jgi:hypothetical protein